MSEKAAQPNVYKIRFNVWSDNAGDNCPWQEHKQHVLAHDVATAVQKVEAYLAEHMKPPKRFVINSVHCTVENVLL